MQQQKIIPDKYGVVLLPGLLPGGDEIFTHLKQKIKFTARQTIDGSYNKDIYYENNTFSLNKFSDNIEFEIEKARKNFDKVISIGVSFGGGLSALLNQKIKFDGNLLISPVFTTQGTKEKYIKLFKRFSHNMGEKEFQRFMKKANLSGYTFEKFQSDKGFLRQRMNAGQELEKYTNIIKNLELGSPTIIYYAEREPDFLTGYKSYGDMSSFEKFVSFMIKISNKNVCQSSRLKHGGIHIDQNPNYAPIKNATGNFQVLTNMSHPEKYLEHGQLQKDLNPYIYALNHLVGAIENNINLSTDSTFAPEKVAWPHVFGIFRGKLRNFYQELLRKKNFEDRELIYMVESLLRIDKKDEIQLNHIVKSFVATGVPTMYYWWKNLAKPNWHPIDLRSQLENIGNS